MLFQCNHDFFVLSYRTAPNIIFDDVSSEDGAISICTISDEDDKPNEKKENVPLQKRRRSSSNSDQMRIYESFAKTMRENHNEKINLIQQLQDPKPQTELECYFNAICKTVEKFPPIER